MAVYIKLAFNSVNINREIIVKEARNRVIIQREKNEKLKKC